MRLKNIAKSNPYGPDYRFYCPGCKTYHVIRTTGTPPLWTFDGDLDEPTVGGSVLTNPHGRYHNPAVPVCHLFIRHGMIQYLSDCTHALAGKTVELPDAETATGGLNET